MKKIYLSLIITIFLVACNSSNKKKSKRLATSVGEINSLTLVTTDSIWNTNLGDFLRNSFGKSIIGIEQDNPIFDIRHKSIKNFKGYATLPRLFVKVDINDSLSNTSLLQDVYAKPQIGIFINAKSSDEAKELINKNIDDWVSKMRETEIKERQRRTLKSLMSDKIFRDSLGFSIKFPSVYRIARKEKNFYWMRKDIKGGDLNMMIYNIPKSLITIDSTLTNQIVKLRDSIGKKFIPGEKEGMHMTTVKDFTPFSFITTINNKRTIETRGNWEVKGDFMAGPFSHFLIDDSNNNRYIVAEGFVYAPNKAKRNFIFELESIVRSIKFKE